MSDDDRRAIRAEWIAVRDANRTARDESFGRLVRRCYANPDEWNVVPIIVRHIAFDDGDVE